MITFKN